MKRQRLHNLRGTRQLLPQRRLRVERRGFKLGSAHIGVLVGVILVAGGLVYLSAINSSAIYGSKMKSLEQEITTLKEEQRDLEIEAMELKSLKTIEEETTEDDDMVVGSLVKYVDARSSYAMNR